jgi:class 3 adenylate cyclase
MKDKALGGQQTGATLPMRPPLLIRPEAILVVDTKDATLGTNLWGWNAVGRELHDILGDLLREAGRDRGLRCVKDTGDGYLATFHNGQSAESAVIAAAETVFDLQARLKARSKHVAEEFRWEGRFAIHFGEVDVLPNEAKGPNVSLTYRLEALRPESLGGGGAINAVSADEFPRDNYVICSEEAAYILKKRAPYLSMRCLGAFRLRSFTGWREVYLVSGDGDSPRKLER